MSRQASRRCTSPPCSSPFSLLHVITHQHTHEAFSGIRRTRLVSLFRFFLFSQMEIFELTLQTTFTKKLKLLRVLRSQRTRYRVTEIRNTSFLSDNRGNKLYSRIQSKKIQKKSSNDRERNTVIKLSLNNLRLYEKNKTTMG